jgi:integrase/recombinase XerD
MEAALQIYDATTVEIPTQAADESHLVRMWLFGKATRTQREYRRDLASFDAYTGGRPLRWVVLADLQGFLDSMAHLAPRTQARRLAAVKSLLSFAQKIGFITFNVGAAVKGPKIRNDLSERILDEEAVLRMIALEPNPRNRALLKLLYGGGLRASESTGLRWADFAETSDNQAVVTVFGKGGKTRHVLITAGVWRDIKAIRRPDDGQDAPVFRSRKGGGVSYCQAWRIVRAAAERARVGKPVSPHWMRHACASHAMDRGAPIHVVQGTLGHSSLAMTGRYLHVRPGESAGRYLAI